MGLFDFLKRSRASNPLAPDPLREALFQAVQSGNDRDLAQLCRAHRATVLQHFSAWQKPPAEVRGNPPAMQQYANGLIGLAQFFASALGDDSLLQRLMGPPQSNPLVQWQERLTEARERMNALRYVEAGEALSDLLIDVRALHGSGADHYLPVTLGHLGECYFQQGEAARALPYLEQALRLCEQSNDIEGVTAYLGNLYEVHRYLGQGPAAADYAELLATALDKQGQAKKAVRYRRQALVVRAGEPLNRVVAVVGGEEFELDEVPLSPNLHVKFDFQRNRPLRQPAEVYVAEGDKFASRDEYDAALDAFRTATRADPYDPHGHYETGVTLLHLQRYAEAIESYEATEERAPGWFHCRADLWLARQLALGNLEHSVFLATRFLEDGSAPPAEKIQLAEQVLTVAPALPLLHLFHGKNLAALQRLEEAKVAYRKGLSSAEEPAVRTRLLVELGILLDPGAERTALLQQARSLNGDLVAAATAYLALKSSGA